MLQIQFNCPQPSFGDQLILTQNFGNAKICYEINIPQLYEKFEQNICVIKKPFTGSKRIINTHKTAIEDEACWLAREIMTNLFFLDFCRNQLSKEINLMKIDRHIFNVKRQLLDQIMLFKNFLNFEPEVWGEFASQHAQSIGNYLEKEIKSFIKIRDPFALQRPVKGIIQELQPDLEDSNMIRLAKLMLSQFIKDPYFFMKRGLCSYILQKKRTVKRILQYLVQLNN